MIEDIKELMYWEQTIMADISLILVVVIIVLLTVFFKRHL